MMRDAILAFVLLTAVSTVVHAQGVREVTSGPKTVVSIAAKVRYTTLIVLPDDEEILDFVCGDKDLWVISGAQNFAYVKPAKAGAATNLNLVTASGHIYSFLLGEGNTDPDLKVYVRPEGATTDAATRPKFHTPAEMQALRSALDDSQRQAQEAREAAARAVEEAAAARLESEHGADERVAVFRAAYPGRLQFPYRFQLNQRPFLVTAIFNDGRFTYIRSKANELPSLYELVDGKPNLVTFQVEDGLYVVPKVLERGYLAIGKERLRFDSGR